MILVDIGDKLLLGYMCCVHIEASFLKGLDARGSQSVICENYHRRANILKSDKMRSGTAFQVAHYVYQNSDTLQRQGIVEGSPVPAYGPVTV